VGAQRVRADYHEADVSAGERFQQIDKVRIHPGTCRRAGTGPRSISIPAASARSRESASSIRDRACRLRPKRKSGERSIATDRAWRNPMPSSVLYVKGTSGHADVDVVATRRDSGDEPPVGVRLIECRDRRAPRTGAAAPRELTDTLAPSIGRPWVSTTTPDTDIRERLQIGLRRPRLATAETRACASMGLARCNWKPAFSDC